jgi:hypothetical protein
VKQYNNTSITANMRCLTSQKSEDHIRVDVYLDPEGLDRFIDRRMYFRSWSISGVQAPVSIESEHNIHILKPE